MSLPLKLGAFSVLIVGVGGTGTWVIWHFGVPEWAPLSLDSDFNTTYKGKYAEKYGQFLVSVGTSTNENIKSDKWWEWSYKNKYLVDIADGATRPPKKGFEKDGISDHEKLKKKCEEAYKLEDSKVKNSETINEGERRKDDIWRYCSNYEIGPKTVEESGESTDTNKFGGANKAKLASTKDNDNDWFWKLRAINFFSSEGNPIKQTGNTHFKDLHKSTENFSEKTKKLKEACKNSYDKGTTDVNTYKDELFKWCSFKGSE